jgi:hypothetical protein
LPWLVTVLLRGDRCVEKGTYHGRSAEAAEGRARKLAEADLDREEFLDIG